MRQALALLLATLLVTVGCLDFSDDVLEPTSAGERVHIPIEVHLVLAGVDPAKIDQDALLAELPTEHVPLVEAPTGTTGEIIEHPVHYTFTYTFHQAPEAFVTGMAEAALATAEEGRPNGWLVAYDQDGPNRICGACTGLAPVDERLGLPDDILYLDAFATERWVLDNLAAHGLDFGRAGVTILLFDGEAGGHLPTETYHYWRFDDGMGHSDVPKTGLAPTVEPPVEAFLEGHVAPYHTPKDTLTMRAWGGRENVLWLDLTAAPSPYDITPRRPLSDETDPPLWDIDPRTAGTNAGKNLADFLLLRVARDAIYPVHAFERFVSPIHVFIEEGAMENPDLALGVDLEAWVPEADIERSIARMMPWIEVETPVTFHFLPQDDPAMADAIKQAKLYGNPTTVSAGIIKAFVRDDWDAYVPAAEPGDFVMPQFYYYFNGPYTFWGVSAAGGWADGDAEGKPWAIFDHFFDLCIRTDVVPCTKATMGFTNLTILPIHEAGHELGLTHTKDRTELDEEGWPDWRVNWLWDSMFSQMSYRHTFMQFDHWDQRFVATAHAVDLIAKTEARGGDALEARAALTEGRYLDAVDAAWAAYRAAESEGLEALSFPDVTEEVTGLTVEIPASASVVSGTNLGILFLPAPAFVPEPLAMAVHTFEVPEDASHVRIAYEDVMPVAAGAHKQVFAVVLGPDGSYRGSLGEAFEDEVVLRSHWRGAGAHELRIYQSAGVLGVYDVEIAIGR